MKIENSKEVTDKINNDCFETETIFERITGLTSVLLKEIGAEKAGLEIISLINSITASAEEGMDKTSKLNTYLLNEVF
jgi:hypothetical protein